MTTEQKAKRYDEAIERAKVYQGLRSEMEIIFPELKESKDERMIKSINRLISHYYDVNFPTPEGFTREELVSWVEKQGEHARFREAIQVGDQVTKNENSVLVNLSQLKRVAKQGEQKQDEKKPAWSEEDEKVYSRIYDLIHAAAFENCEVDDNGNELGEYAKMTSLLKSLKDRHFIESGRKKRE